jgi:hypothetical protein
MSIGKKLFGIFYAPHRVLAIPYRKYEWAFPLAVFLILFFLLNTLIVYRIGPGNLGKLYYEKLRSSKLVAEEKLIEQSKAYGHTSSAGLALDSTALYLALILVFAFLLHAGIGIAGGRAAFLAVFTMVSYIALIRLLKTLITAILVFSHPEPLSFDPLPSHLGLVFMGQYEGFIPNVLTAVDIFSLWMAALAALGCEKLAGMKRLHAVILAGALWLIPFLYSLLQVYLLMEEA